MVLILIPSYSEEVELDLPQNSEIGNRLFYM